MPLLRFRLRTLMIAVAVVGTLLAILVAMNDANELNQLVVKLCMAAGVVMVAIAAAMIWIVEFLFPPSDRPHRE